MEEEIEFGIIGLGKMGGSLARQALEKGIRVVGTTKNEPDQDLLDLGLDYIEDYGEFVEKLDAPRVVFLYVPAGPLVDTLADRLASSVEEGDVMVDGGNSYWGDSIRRAERYRERGIDFVDCGTSGGIDGARHGACFMYGGSDRAADAVGPILKRLAVDEKGAVHTGPSGSGHYVKLVHNSIEFGMLQAIGEGMNLLTRYPEDLPISDVLTCWNHGSVIRSWLVELMEQQYRERGGMKDVPAYVEDTGEVNWLVNDAMNFEMPIPVIAQSVMQLFSSRDDRQDWAKAIAMMRHGFGGHPFGSEEGIARERREGRVRPFPEEMAPGAE